MRGTCTIYYILVEIRLWVDTDRTCMMSIILQYQIPRPQSSYFPKNLISTFWKLPTGVATLRDQRRQKGQCRGDSGKGRCLLQGRLGSLYMISRWLNSKVELESCCHRCRYHNSCSPKNILFCVSKQAKKYNCPCLF